MDYKINDLDNKINDLEEQNNKLYCHLSEDKKALADKIFLFYAKKKGYENIAREMINQTIDCSKNDPDEIIDRAKVYY